jgi:hypothetical protein
MDVTRFEGVRLWVWVGIFKRLSLFFPQVVSNTQSLNILIFRLFFPRYFYTSTFYFRYFSFDLFTFDIFTFDLSWKNRLCPRTAGDGTKEFANNSHTYSVSSSSSEKKRKEDETDDGNMKQNPKKKKTSHAAKKH